MTKRPSLPEAPSDKNAASLQARLEAAEQRYSRREAIPPAPPSALSLSMDFVGGVTAGGIIGYAIDQFFNSLPLFFLICLLLGAVGGVANMWKRIRQAPVTQDNRHE